jgi:hypothetical protein
MKSLAHSPQQHPQRIYAEKLASQLGQSNHIRLINRSAFFMSINQKKQ